MKRQIHFWILLTASLGLCTSCGSSTSKEKRAIEEAFESYRTALLEADGKAGAKAVAADTIEYYQEMRDLAISGEVAEVKKLSMINRMMVFSMRHRIDPEQLTSMNGSALFSYAVDEGWIGKDSVIGMGLKDIAIVDNQATATATKDGKNTPATFYFAKEDGQWKIDLKPMMTLFDQALRKVAKDSNMSENEFIFSLLASVSGREIDSGIWKPRE